MLQPDTELHFCVPSNLPSKSGRSFDVLGTLCFFCGFCCKVFADYKPFYRNVLVTGVFWLPIALSTAFVRDCTSFKCCEQRLERQVIIFISNTPWIFPRAFVLL